MRRSSRSGFTLIEILIVVGILAILVVVLVGALLMAVGKGDEAKAKNFVGSAMSAAVSKWQGEAGKNNSTYPDSPGLTDGDKYFRGNAELFKIFVTDPQKAGDEPYITSDLYVEGEEGGKKVFIDPWNNPYIYRNYAMKKKIKGSKGRSPIKQKYNPNTYDMISMGPDGQLYEFEGNNDDIYNGK